MADDREPLDEEGSLLIGADPLQAGPIRLPPEAPDAPEPVSGPSGWLIGLFIALAVLIWLAWMT